MNRIELVNCGVPLVDIVKELERAEKKFPTWPEDLVYQAGIVCEEAGEVLKAANEIVEEIDTGKYTTVAEMRKELIQTIATACRAIAYLDEYGDKYDEREKIKCGGK